MIFYVCKILYMTICKSFFFLRDATLTHMYILYTVIRISLQKMTKSQTHFYQRPLCASLHRKLANLFFFLFTSSFFLKKLVFVLRRKLFYQCVKNVASYVYNDKFPWNSQIKKILLPQCRLFWNAIRNEKPS